MLLDAGNNDYLLQDLVRIRSEVQRSVRIELVEPVSPKTLSAVDEKFQAFLSQSWGFSFYTSERESLLKSCRTLEAKWRELKSLILSHQKDPEKINTTKKILTSAEEFWLISNDSLTVIDSFIEKKKSIFRLSLLFSILNTLITFAILFLNLKWIRNELEPAAHFDELTGCYNRRTFESKLRKMLGRTKLDAKTFALAICDIDHFKAVNDTYGHDVGDKVLKNFSNLLKEKLRRSDLLARIGGEEFVVILDGVSELAAAEFLYSQLRAHVERAHFETVGRITMSVGFTFSQSQDTLIQVLKRADIALYQSKENGRNRVSFN
jgi:diguanylate cyclase (GGDEF)-like protein